MLWSRRSIAQRDNTWLPERSAGLGKRSRARTLVAGFLLGDGIILEFYLAALKPLLAVDFFTRLAELVVF